MGYTEQFAVSKVVIISSFYLVQESDEHSYV